jgi:hypothetical protein
MFERRGMRSRKCSATKENGQPCRSYALPATDPPRCYFHTRTKDQQLEMSQKGGLGKRRKELPVSWPVVEWIVDLVVKVVNGTLSTEPAVTILAPAIARGHEHDLRELLDTIRVWEEAELQDPHDRLEEAREALRELYIAGKIGLDQLPPEVLNEDDLASTHGSP